MATAYAALLSLTNTISMERTSGPSHAPIPFDASLIDALLQRVDFFVECLEQGWKGAEHLEARITDLAYAAEDAIESPIVDTVLTKLSRRRSDDKRPVLPRLVSSSNHSGSEDAIESPITDLVYAAEDAIGSPIVDTVLRLSNSSNDSVHDFKCQDLNCQDLETIINDSVHDFKCQDLNCQDLETIIYEMDSIKAEMMENRMKDHPRCPSRFIGSTSGPHQEKNKLVGFEEEKIRIMEQLESGESRRKLISVHGMGGSGKTTLAQTIYDHQRVVHYFDIRGWVTVSQQYSVKEMLKNILSCLKIKINEIDKMDEGNLGQTIHKSLWGRRYLVVLDDIWDIDAWDKIRRFFPDNSNGRILLTTRLSNLANDASIKMKHLDEDNSWKLLCEKVFGHGSCPNELEQVGKQIAKNCRGLPLTVAVIGGFLAKSSLTLEYWNNVAEDFNSYLKDDDHCSKILSLSYDHLPVHLKPCFLYLGIFPEDYEISIGELINLWVAEGFLKSHGGKILEEIAEEYLNDLTERNLIIMDSKLQFDESKRYCKIHDLLRELCMQEAQKDRFFYVVTHNNPSVPRNLCHQRRLVVQHNSLAMREDIVHHITNSLPSILHVRSLILNFPSPALKGCGCGYGIFKLLRILFMIEDHFDLQHNTWEAASNLVNLRYFNHPCDIEFSSNILSNVHLFRNIQMQQFTSFCSDIASLLGEMPSVINIGNWPQLRHLNLEYVALASPTEDCVVLENLQTMDGVVNLKLDEAMCHRIPNVKTVGLSYWNEHCDIMIDESLDSNYEILDPKFGCSKIYKFMIHNLSQFQKLESLNLNFKSFSPECCCTHHRPCHFLCNVVLPHSLKKLEFACTWCSWEDMTVIGSLPNLEILILDDDAFIGTEWNPVQGEFLHLKLLLMSRLVDLVYWNADCTHFPVLEELKVSILYNLTEIPLDIGEISTLRSITLRYCNYATGVSAKNILNEQRNLGNDTLVVDIVQHWSLG